MLKHLKMKAAAENPKSDVEEVILSDSLLGKTKNVAEAETKEFVEPTPCIGPLELPLYNSQSGNENISRNGNPHFDRDDRVIHKWRPLSDTQLDLDTHNSGVIYNYKSTCTDPGCHCSPTSPRKVFPHSPKIEEFCHCLSCQQMPRLVHHNHVPYCHSSGAHIPESASHLRHPTGGVFYPPEPSINNPHPVYHSPTITHPSGSDWARYVDPAFSHNTQNLFNRGSYSRDSRKLPLSTFSVPSTSTAASDEIQKLPLPLSRATIVSLVRSGKCDIILESLNGPLHDESSPSYPLALKTVLEILDVIEKDFTHTYKSDRKVESDIHQLSNFVKNMEKSTLGESSVNYSEHQKVLTTPPKPARMEVGAQFPDMPSASPHTAADDKLEAVPEGKTPQTDVQTAPLGSAGKVALDNDTEKKPLPSINIGGAVISGDDIANILAAFREKSTLPSPPVTVDNLAGKPAEQEQDIKSDEEINVVDILNPTEGKTVANKPQTVESNSTVPSEQLGGQNKPDIASVEATEEEMDSTTVALSQSANLPKDQLDMDVVDALLDQTLLEADKARDESNKSQKKVVGSEPSSSYRSKGFKIRSVGSTEEGQMLAKTKGPVKTFAQILTDRSKPLNFSTDSQVAVNQKPKDVNGNLPYGSSLDHDNTQSASSDEKKGTTPELLPRCPSNPLSPSESLDGTDTKSVLFKKKIECAEEKSTSEPVVKPGVTSLTVSSNSAKEGMQVKLPGSAELGKSAGIISSKESALPNSIGKPLMSKSFHGKLLLQKNSKDDPCPIPLEVTDPSLMLRDPRLALSNLMDYRGNPELAVLHWQTDASDSNQKTCLKGTDTSSLPPLNVRDPRVRRRLSGDTCPGGQTNVQKISLESSIKEDETSKEILPKVQNSDRNSLNMPSVECHFTPYDKPQANEFEGRHLKTEHQSVGTNKRESSLIKAITACVGDSKHANTVSMDVQMDQKKHVSQKPHVKSVIVADDLKKKEDYKVSNQTPVKSVIVTEGAQKGNAEKPKIASALGPLNDSVDKMDTKFSFQESLSVLKGIKSDIKKELNSSGGKMEKVDRDRASTLLQRVTVLARAVEISLLTTEVQKKKASGGKADMLSGILEDHFILSADLIIMGLWLKGENPSTGGKGLSDFRKGVFSRRTAPSLKKIHRWLKNRYEIDGFKDKALTNLTNMIAEDEVEQRSRSRSSSTGSDRNKRKRSESSLSSERQRVKSIDSGSHHRCADDKKVTEDKPMEESKGKTPKSAKHVSSEKGEKKSGAAESDAESVADRKAANSVGSSSESDEGKPELAKGVVKRKTTGEEDEKEVKKCKQSVTVSNCIQDLPQEMSDIKREVLIALSDRNTKIANKCLEKLPEMSRKAHAQLDDENKTYTSLKNVSPDTRAKFNDVIKGIQRLIVDCEIMIYSLSWNANRTVARKAKDAIWTIAQKSSHKPSYEEELALLLSLRKAYTSTDLWRYVKNDVDERIASLQKKCRSSQKIAALIQDYPISDRKPPWSTAPQAPQYPAGGPSQDGPPMQSSIPVHQGYDRASNVRYNGPSNKNFGYQDNYIPSVVRNNYVNRPAQPFPPSNTVPYHREGYPLPSQPPNQMNFQRHPAPPPPPPMRGPPRDCDYWRYEKSPDNWDAGRGKPTSGSYDGGNRYTPPLMM